MKSFACIGTREPDAKQERIAAALVSMATARNGFVTTGAAQGIDLIAMQSAAEGRLHVYLPWESYNAGIIPVHAHRTVYDRVLHTAWTESVIKYHPAAARLSRGAFALHARNYGIVAPTQLVLAFPNEKGEGGTGQGIRIAKDLGINLIQVNKYSVKDADEAVRTLWEQVKGWLDAL